MTTKTLQKKKPAPAPKPSAPGLVVMRIELTPEAKQQTLDVAERLGMTQFATLSRIVEWFSGQPEAVQQAVTSNPTAPAAPDVLRQILGPMTEQRASGRRS